MLSNETNRNPRKAIAYIRVSSQRQVDEGVSIQAQKRRILEYVRYKKLDLSPDDIIIEEGVSGGRMHLSQLGGKERLMCDEHGLKVETQNGSVVLELGQRFNCRFRGLDIWSGALDLTPI